MQRKFLSSLDLAQTVNLPYPIADADYQQDNKYAKQRSRPLLETSREQTDNPAPVGHTQPCDE